MPRGYHPCFRRGAQAADTSCWLQFDSDGHIYRYTGVNPEGWAEFLAAASKGTDFNVNYRGVWLAFTRQALWPRGLDSEL
jgi:hypothetical protein